MVEELCPPEMIINQPPDVMVSNPSRLPVRSNCQQLQQIASLRPDADELCPDSQRSGRARVSRRARWKFLDMKASGRVLNVDKPESVSRGFEL